MGNGRGDLDDAPEVRHFSHSRDDPVAHRSLQTQGISDYKNLLAFIRQAVRESKRPRTLSGQVDTQQRQVGFFVHRKRAGHRISSALAVERMNLNAVRAANDVRVCDYFSGTDKESAAANQRLSLRVIGQNGDNRRLNATDEIRK